MGLHTVFKRDSDSFPQGNYVDHEKIYDMDLRDIQYGFLFRYPSPCRLGNVTHLLRAHL